MTDPEQAPLMEISSGIAQIYKARYGRGPERITAHIHDDAVVCLLRGVNTPAQAALVAYGRADSAQTVHKDLQMGMASEMSAMIERLTGRTVTGYVPGFNASADATTDTFLLEAADDEEGEDDAQEGTLTVPEPDGRIGDELRRLAEALARTRTGLDRLVDDLAAHPGVPEDSFE